MVNITHGKCTGSRCGECLIKDGCSWCKDTNFTSMRCANESQLKTGNCTNIVTRKAHKMKLVENNDFSDGGTRQDSVQIKPQHVKIRLVPNKEFTGLKIQYKIAKNFPLDLYFLNDPSYTMIELKEKLSTLAREIAQDIKNLTTNFQFGLGTAMDKVILPFTRTSTKYIENPCSGTKQKCEKPYSYRHRLNFTRNITLFQDAVDAIMTTANFDKPEGMFDGLLQAMVCKDKIGWRKKARRMLLYATDINFHQAGDGRLAGILEPNDGLCHLDSTGFYTKAEVQDYPSVGQIIQKALENNVNVIFVIGGNSSQLNNQQVRSHYYDNLAQLLPGVITEASSLSTSASNILEIVRKNYEKLQGTVKLLIDKDDKKLDVTIYTNCRTGRKPDKTNICERLTNNKTVTFIPLVKSNFDTCPEQRNLTFSIFPEGLEERVRVDIEHVCDCDCELEPEVEPSSPKCSFNGTFECGICKCNPGWIGESCECDNRGTAEEKCGTENGICNNAGNCICRKCECFKGYSGNKCECNDENCRTYNKLLCGGPSQGRCDCGQCVCNANYTGNACECLTSTDPCKNNNGTICSGNGECECGRCRCNSGWRGTLCNSCTSCPGICNNNKDCAECVAFNQGKYNTTLCQNRCNNVWTAPLLKPATKEDDNATVKIKSCMTEDSFGCIISFNVYDSELGQEVVVKDTKRCPAGPPNLLLVGLSISGAIFLVGLLLLLLWKLLTMLYDSMEYSRFESEIKDPAWEKSENPIYKECVTTVQNPMHESGFNQDNIDDNDGMDFLKAQET
ncbi:integrin beta-3-like [Saccostrea echinata]|uniref:integrin beta-3-like n=1 Tax=Saccostrea echinata TaxID=191078 RepID=UPI002A8365BD|nr:integrin beta-3-like [Saccostrea echinata]